MKEIPQEEHQMKQKEMIDKTEHENAQLQLAVERVREI